LLRGLLRLDVSQVFGRFVRVDLGSGDRKESSLGISAFFNLHLNVGGSAAVHDFHEERLKAGWFLRRHVDRLDEVSAIRIFVGWVKSEGFPWLGFACSADCHRRDGVSASPASPEMDDDSIRIHAGVTEDDLDLVLRSQIFSEQFPEVENVLLLPLRIVPGIGELSFRVIVDSDYATDGNSERPAQNGLVHAFHLLCLHCAPPMEFCEYFSSYYIVKDLVCQPLYKKYAWYNILYMSHLNEKQLQELKEQLEKEAGELEAQLANVSKTADFGNDTETDFSQEADEAEEFSSQLGMQETFKERLQDIEAALEKISKGEYGKCEKCGKDISLELLKVNPESRLCKECKSEN